MTMLTSRNQHPSFPGSIRARHNYPLFPPHSSLTVAGAFASATNAEYLTAGSDSEHSPEDTETEC